MSPAPDLSDEGIILNPLSPNAVLSAISSSDELDPHLSEKEMDLGFVLDLCLKKKHLFIVGILLDLDHWQWRA